MPTELQFRRYNDEEIGNLTGKDGEIFINTTDNSLHIQDGVAQGGFKLAATFDNLSGNIDDNIQLVNALAEKASATAFDEHISGQDYKHSVEDIDYDDSNDLKTIVDTKANINNVILNNGTDQTIKTNDNLILNLFQASNLQRKAKLKIGTGFYTEDSGVSSELELTGKSNSSYRFFVENEESSDGILKIRYFDAVESAQTLDLITIKSSGNIGIGTDMPSTKLEVDGNIIASDPLVSSHVATKNYVDQAVDQAVQKFEQEVISSVNGSLTEYQLSNLPIEKSLMVFIDGVYQNRTFYSIDEDIITFTFDVNASSVVSVFYHYHTQVITL